MSEKPVRSRKRIFHFLMWMAGGSLGALLIIFITAEVLTSSSMNEALERMEADGHAVTMTGAVQHRLETTSQPETSTESGEDAADTIEEMYTAMSEYLKTLDERITAEGYENVWEALKDPTTVSPEVRKLLIEAFGLDSPLTQYLKRIAEAPDYGYTDQDFSKPPYQWKRPRLAGLMRLFKYSCAAVNALAVEGRTEEAVDLWNIGQRGSRHFIERPTSLIDFLVGQGHRQYVTDAVKWIGQGGDLTPARIGTIIEGLDPSGLRQGAIDAIEIERIQKLEMCRLLIEDGVGKHIHILGQPDSERLDKPAYLLYQSVSFLMRPILRRDTIRMQERDLELEAILQGEPWTWNAALEEFDTKGYVSELPRWNVLSRMMTANIEGRMINIPRLESQTQIARLALACKAWQTETGAYPTTLTELEGSWFESIPVDPCTGQPFDYEVDPDGFTIRGLDSEASGDQPELVWREDQ